VPLSTSALQIGWSCGIREFDLRRVLFVSINLVRLSYMYVVVERRSFMTSSGGGRSRSDGLADVGVVVAAVVAGREEE